MNDVYNVNCLMESWLPVQPGVWCVSSKCHPLPTLPIEGTFFINILMSEWKGAWFYEGWLRHWGLIVLIQIGSAAGTSGRPNRLWLGEGRTACWWLHTVTEHLLSFFRLKNSSYKYQICISICMMSLLPLHLCTRSFVSIKFHYP